MDATEPPDYLPPSATPTPTAEGGSESYAEFDPAKMDEDDVLSFEDGDESVVEHSLYEPIYVEDSDDDDDDDDDDIDGSKGQNWNCTEGNRNLNWVQEMAVAFGSQEKKEKKKEKGRKMEKEGEKEREEEDPLDDGREDDRAFWAACLASGYP